MQEFEIVAMPVPWYVCIFGNAQACICAHVLLEYPQVHTLKGEQPDGQLFQAISKHTGQLRQG